MKTSKIFFGDSSLKELLVNYKRDKKILTVIFFGLHLEAVKTERNVKKNNYKIFRKRTV
jgi:hypothetical protein